MCGFSKYCVLYVCACCVCLHVLTERLVFTNDYEKGPVTDADCLPVRVLGPLQEGFYRVLFESGTAVSFEMKFARLKRKLGPKKHVSLP